MDNFNVEQNADNAKQNSGTLYDDIKGSISGVGNRISSAGVAISGVGDQIGNRISDVGSHFSKVFSNVANGKASTGEYLEVGAIAVGTAAGTAAAARFGVGRLMQRGPAGALAEGRLVGAKPKNAVGGLFTDVGKPLASIPDTEHASIRVVKWVSKRTPDSDIVRKLVGSEVASWKNLPLVFGKNMESLGTIPSANGGKTLGFTIKASPNQTLNPFVHSSINKGGAAPPERWMHLLVNPSKNNPTVMSPTTTELLREIRLHNLPRAATIADESIKINPLNASAARLHIAFRAEAFLAGKTHLDLVKPLANDGSAFSIMLPAGRTASTKGLKPPEWESIVKMPRATDEGLAKMFPSLWNSHQLNLTFKGSKVSDDGLKILADLKGRVNHLDVRDTQVTRSGYKWIQKELPDATVIW